MNIEHIFSMGGYGVYVWSAYTITAIVFIINVVSVVIEKSLAKKIIRNFYEP